MFGPSDVKLHNLKAAGRDRKIWHLYDLADSVWGHRPVAAKKTIDTDEDKVCCHSQKHSPIHILYLNQYSVS